MASTEFATRSHKGAGFLFLVGFALVATGLAFAFAPHYSWQVTQIAQKASALGVPSGLLVVGGLFFFGLGIVARVAGSTAPVLDTRGDSEAIQAELHVVNEQISTKLAQLRTSLMQIHEGVAAVSSAQQAQIQSESDKGPSAGNHSQDAVFRLAASLDKLHAHFDERVHAVDLQLRSGFETLLNVSHEVRRALGNVPPAASQAAVPHAPHAPQAPHAHHGHHGHAPSNAPESGIDFYETMQKLDAIAGEPSTERSPGHQPQAPFPSQGHGGEALDVLLPEEYRDRY